MITKEIKKGTQVRLRNGWEAQTLGSARGTTVVCEVYGFCTECGSVYGHDIVQYQDVYGAWHDITGYTPCQIKCQKMANQMGW